MVEEFKHLNRLTLAEVNVRKVVTIQDSRLHFREVESLKDLLIWAQGKAKVGKRVGIYSFNATIVAQVDLSGIGSEQIRQSADGVWHLTVPSIQVRLLGRDFTLKKEYERVDLLRDAITPQERAQAKEYATARLEKEVIGNAPFVASVREKAQAKLKDAIVQLLLLHGEKDPAVHLEYVAETAAQSKVVRS